MTGTGCNRARNTTSVSVTPCGVIQSKVALPFGQPLNSKKSLHSETLRGSRQDSISRGEVEQEGDVGPCSS